MKKLFSIVTILTLLMPHASYAKVDKDVNVAKVQAMLAELCYEPGIVDGAWGKKTETAVKAFFAKHYRKYDGNFDVKDANFILSAGASAKAFGSETIKKCLVVYSDRIGNSLNNDKIKQITQKVANKKKKSKKLKPFTSKSSTKNLKSSCPNGSEPKKTLSANGSFFTYKCSVSSSSGIDKSLDPNGQTGLPEISYPNDQTLKYILYKYLYYGTEIGDRYHLVKASNPYSFKFDLRDDKYIKRQMQETSLLSYLLYEDGKIVIDEITPEDRFGDMFKDTSVYLSQSMGKSITSYITGHAICDGYIKSVDARLDDWPILEGTLYHNQKLINILNMAAGDQAYIRKKGFTKSSRGLVNANMPSVQSIMKNELKGSKKSHSRYNYVNSNPNLVLSYILFKYGDADFKQLLNDVFQKKVRIKDEIFLNKNVLARKDEHSLFHQFYATRYDYLRIAKAMLDDWQNDTCVGKYLKTIHERRIPKKDRQGKIGRLSKPLSYGGFFHTGFKGMENRPVMSMDGFGGQTIAIDFERGRIVATLAVHDNMQFPKSGSFNYNKISYQVIKNGKPASILPAKEKLTAEPVIDPQQLILDYKARKETEREAKKYWDNYYAEIFWKDVWGDKYNREASSDGFIMLSENFENSDQTDIRVEDRNNQWHVKRDNDGNSIYCNKRNSGWTDFTFGSEHWSDYSISYRMKLPTSKVGRLETHIRKKNDGDYRAMINSSGRSVIQFTKSANENIGSGYATTKLDQWSKIELIASSDNIKYLVDGQLVVGTKDNRLRYGAGMIAVSPFLEVCVDDIVVKKVSSKNK